MASGPTLPVVNCRRSFPSSADNRLASNVKSRKRTKRRSALPKNRATPARAAKKEKPRPKLAATGKLGKTARAASKSRKPAKRKPASPPRSPRHGAWQASPDPQLAQDRCPPQTSRQCRSLRPGRDSTGDAGGDHPVVGCRDHQQDAGRDRHELESQRRDALRLQRRRDRRQADTGHRGTEPSRRDGGDPQPHPSRRACRAL